MNRRNFCLATMGLMLTPTIRAQHLAYPNRAIRMISPYAAGGGPDVQLRQISQSLGALMGEPVIVENKVGAAGVTGAVHVKSARADGYTLLMGSNTHLIQKTLRPNLNFDPIADFSGVSNLFAQPTVLVVSKDSRFNSIEQIIEEARKNPGVLNYASGGVGTSAHLAGATFFTLAEAEATHIPLKGSVEIGLSLLRGDVDLAFPVSSTALPQVNDGSLKALATSSSKRLKMLPDVPTMNEIFDNPLTVQESWFGVWAPRGVESSILEAMNAAIVKVLSEEEILDSLDISGALAMPSKTPAEFDQFIHDENDKWAAIIELTGTQI